MAAPAQSTLCTPGIEQGSSGIVWIAIFTCGSNPVGRTQNVHCANSMREDRKDHSSGLGQQMFDKSPCSLDGESDMRLRD